MSEFDKTTKLRFSNPTEPSYICLGTVKDRDLAFWTVQAPGVCDTVLRLTSSQCSQPRTDVATLFEPSAAAIIDAVENQRRLATKPIQRTSTLDRSTRRLTTAQSIFLVGGFAASDSLFSKLQGHIRPLNLDFCRPDSHINKAVADGALAFYLDHRVSARVSKFTYGTQCAVEFNKNNEQHKLRAASAIPRPLGHMVLPNTFSAILHKGTAVSETKDFRKDFITECAERTSCDTITTKIVCYRGDASNPRWTDSEPGRLLF
ncbi:hypothetical protein JVT61DRAFT_9110 [Boletus reticuloceps]|uniref:Uncharacterized protein n=1 Tax=Boletus reticuloceps TaxID=495285 RepID=A0A8I2YI38_9AGAM|nr:hypothetical protein JVT61DRAFT_9110 [Boletus reticuloceps]